MECTVLLEATYIGFISDGIITLLLLVTVVVNMLYMSIYACNHAKYAILL